MYKLSEVNPKRLISLFLGQLHASLSDYENVHQRMFGNNLALRKEKLDCL